MKTTKLVAIIVIHANEIDNLDIRKANIFWKEKSTEIYMSEGLFVPAVISEVKGVFKVDFIQTGLRIESVGDINNLLKWQELAISMIKELFVHLNFKQSKILIETSEVDYGYLD